MLRFCAIAALAATTNALAAQTADSTRLPRVVVTATRVESRIGSNIASVALLDGDSLRARGIDNVADALRETPGAAIVRSGSFGAQTSLFLRGGESDYVRVLLDGVPMNAPGGSIDLSALTLDNVERIEVVRGPTSVLYGSDAVTGVIQIFTRRQTSPRSASASVSAGSYGTRTADLALGAASSRASISLGAARRATDGILDFNNEYENTTFSARAAMTTGGLSATLTGRQHKDEFHYPTDGAGRVVDRNAFRSDRRSAVALSADHQLNTAIRAHLGFSAMEGRPTTDDPSDGTGDTVGFYAYRSNGSLRRRVADASIDVSVTPMTIATLGYEWQRESQHGRDSSNFDAAPNDFAARRVTRATYAQLVGESRRLSYTIGGRYDDNDVFGVFRTARAGLALRITDQTTIRANVGSAFKAPTFLEQFNTAFTVGNTALRPERSRSLEVSVREAIGSRNELIATWFTQRFRDLIQYSFVAPTTPNYFNIAAASARGLEIEGRSRVTDATQLGASITLLRTRVDDAGFDSGANATFVEGKRLLRRPSATGTFSVTSRVTNRLTWDARLLIVGSRDDRDFSDFPARPVVLESYQRFDAGIAYAVAGGSGSTWTVFARADNVFGAEYEEVANFRAPGRTLSLGLRAAVTR